MIRTATLLLTGLTLSACAASRGSGSHRSPYGPDRVTDPIVEVRNDHLLSIQIFTFWSGSRYFLGEVSPGTVRTFRIPRDVVQGNRIQLMADPLGSANEYVTDPIELGGVHRIQWHVRTYLRGSRLRIM
jgi:hypothetical protein